VILGLSIIIKNHLYEVSMLSAYLCTYICLPCSLTK